MLLIFLPRKRQQRSTPPATFSSLEGTQESWFLYLNGLLDYLEVREVFVLMWLWLVESKQNHNNREHIPQNYHIFILLYFKSQPLYCDLWEITWMQNVGSFEPNGKRYDNCSSPITFYSLLTNFRKCFWVT